MAATDPAESAGAHDGAAELRRRVEESRVRYRLDELIGMPVAEARAVVHDAGGKFATDDGPITANIDPHRVIASVTDGRVTRVGIG